MLHDGELSVGGDLKTGILQNYNPALKTSRYKRIFEGSIPILSAICAILTGTITLGTFRDSIILSNNTRTEVHDLQDRISELYSILSDIETENQQLRDTIYSFLMDETVSGSVSELK